MAKQGTTGDAAGKLPPIMVRDVPTDAWTQGEEQPQVERFRLILRVIAQRARVMGITSEEYFAGIIAGTYPRVEQFEIDVLTHDD